MTYVEINDWAAEDQVLSQKLNQMVENLTTIHDRHSMTGYVEHRDEDINAPHDNLNYVRVDLAVKSVASPVYDIVNDFEHYVGDGDNDTEEAEWDPVDISHYATDSLMTVRWRIRIWEDDDGIGGVEEEREYTMSFVKTEFIDSIQGKYWFRVDNRGNNPDWWIRSYMKFFNSEVE